MNEFEKKLRERYGEGQKVIAESAQRRAQIADWQHKRLVALAGDSLDQLLRSREKAAESLRDPKWQIRTAAIYILRDQWRQTSDPELQQVFEKIARSDPSSQVRCAAWDGLTRCYARTDDVRIGRLLAEVVLDKTESCEVRLTAVICLYTLRGAPLTDWEALTAHSGLTSRTLDDIDMPFVKSFLAEGRTPCPVDLMATAFPHLPEKERAFYGALRQGRLAFERGEYEEAIHILTPVVSYPPLEVARYTRGRAYMELGQFDAAIDDFSQLIDKYPSSSKFYLARSEAHERNGHAELAERDKNNGMRVKAESSEDLEKGDS